MSSRPSFVVVVVVVVLISRVGLSRGHVRGDNVDDRGE